MNKVVAFSIGHSVLAIIAIVSAFLTEDLFMFFIAIGVTIPAVISVINVYQHGRIFELEKAANQNEQPTTGKHVTGLTIFEDGKPTGGYLSAFKAPETPNAGYYDESEYTNPPSFSSPGFTTRYKYPFGLPVVVAVTNTFEDDVSLDIYETVCLFNSINTTISEGGFSGEMDFGEGISATWSLIAGDEELTSETASLEYLQALLSKAEAEQDFERAAQLRDQINALKND
jgi:hypothetical protein